MDTTAKNKLCWNCEGRISLAEEVCPYCGVSVIPASLGEGHPVTPYQSSSKEQTVPSSPFGPLQKEPESEERMPEPEEEEASINEFKRVALSLILLLAGSMFFLFGLTLALFSHGGVFTLQWNSAFWFIYMGISLPLLFFGWRTLLKLDSDRE